jgi:hypothetical protein
MERDAILRTQKPPDHEADFVTALLPGSSLRALDRYIAKEAPAQTRSSVLTLAFKEWCIDRGYMRLNGAAGETHITAESL